MKSSEKRAMLSAHLERFDPKTLVLTETWLEESVARVDIPNYQSVSPRDRPTSKVGKSNFGGIALKSRIGSVLVTHFEDSNIAESTWHIVHTDIGGVLLAAWYRPLEALRIIPTASTPNWNPSLQLWQVVWWSAI